MDVIKEVAVITVDHQVHRQRFCQINQMEGKTVSQYVAKVKAQADLCSFQIECSTCQRPASYLDEMVASQTINGLAKQQFQSRVLEETRQCQLVHPPRQS